MYFLSYSHTYAILNYQYHYIYEIEFGLIYFKDSAVLKE